MTVCIVGTDEPTALEQTLASVRSHGLPVQVGAVEDAGGTPGLVAFGNAANWPSALGEIVAAASTDWVLLVHAGERVELDTVALRAACQAPVDAWRVEQPVGLLPACPLLPAERLVRRSAAVFGGLVLPRCDGGPASVTTAVRLSGVPVGADPYGPTMHWLLRSASRVERAFPTPQVRSEVAVLLAAAGEFDAAVVRLSGIDAPAPHGETDRRLGRALVAAGLAAGRPREARLGALRWYEASETTGPAHAWLAQIETAVGRPGSAVRLFDDLGTVPLVDDDGYRLDPVQVRTWRGIALHHLDELEFEVGRALQLSSSLDPATRKPGPLHERLIGIIVSGWSRLRREPAALLERLSDDDRALAARILCKAPVEEPTDWAAMFDALVGRDGLDEALAARLAEVAPMFPETDALRWAARLRQEGFGRHCPLLARARSVSLDPLTRLRSVAIALEVFGDDPDIAELLAASAGLVAEGELESMLLLVDELAPRALPGAVIGAATTPARMLALAVLLDRFGAAEQAGALRDAAAQAVGRSSRTPLGFR